jgi:hypothetical protein
LNSTYLETFACRPKQYTATFSLREFIESFEFEGEIMRFAIAVALFIIFPVCVTAQTPASEAEATNAANDENQKAVLETWFGENQENNNGNSYVAGSGLEDLKWALTTSANNNFLLTDPSISYNEAVETLANAGWDEDKLKATLSAGETYNLWRAGGPNGSESWVAQPLSDMSKAIKYSFESTPTGNAEVITAGWMPQSWTIPDKDEIQKTIIDGMQSSIDALCGMKARPVEITVKGSVPGILEIAAKWETEDVCDERISAK